MKAYIPNPLDTEHIVLPEALNELTEQMARNVHEVWAKGRIDEGWSYGEQRDDQQKKHPCLVAYEELPETEREYDRNTAIQTLKLILKLGFKISKYSIRSIDSAVIARIKRIYRGFCWTMGGTLAIAALVIVSLAFSPYFEYDSWPILVTMTIVGLCAICWTGYYGRQLLKIYTDSRKQIFDTELSLYRESVRREELILNEQTNDELQNLKIEIKRKDLKIAELEKEIKKIKEGK